MKTLKAVVAKYNQTSLILRILIGLAVGSVLALVAPGAGWVGELGSLFVGALKGIAPVLVFVIVASALAQGSSKLDRRFGTVIWLYMLTTFLAAAIAVITSFMFPVKVVLADASRERKMTSIRTSKTILAMVRQRMLFSGQKPLPKFITTSLAI